MSRRSAVCVPVALCMILLCVSCIWSGGRGGCGVWNKVELDVAELDAEGLRGPEDGKVAVAYEFCIPDTDQCRAEVAAIDTSVEFMPGSRGRIGVGEGECLCIGSTHQKGYRAVLEALAALPYIERIIECHFE